jgi:dihydroorotate dehydrogenase (NAD+) catalytic subunit
VPAATDDPILATTLAGLSLRNPVMLAAGTHGTLDEFGEVCPLSAVGAIVAKSLTPLAREGNATWRIIPARSGMLNAIGLANPGVERFDANVAEKAATLPTVVIGSAAGFSVQDYVRVVATLDAWADRGIPAVELNVSCPNVHTGTEFGSSPALLAELMRGVRPAAPRAKLLVKLSPATPDIVAVAAAAIEHGADALVLCNTMPAMAIDVRTRRPRLANVTGGFSGPGVHPAVVKIIYEVYRKVAKGAGVPIVGVGGVMTWEDAAEFILAGATAVELGTVLFADPRAPVKVAKGLAKWARSQRVASIGELVGAVAV